MFRKIFQYLRYYDWVLFFSALLLVSFSLAALYGIATSFDQPNFSNFFKQLIFVGIGLILYGTISLIDYSSLKSYAYIFYIFIFGLLTWVLFFGQTLRGTTGWINIFGFAFQPVELAKLALLVVVAKMFSNQSLRAQNLLFLLRTTALTVMYFFLIILQPDFGSAILLLLMWSGMLILSGVSKKYIFGIAALVALAFIMGWLFFFQAYQKDRILTFFQPTADPLGSGYNVRQSIIAIGSGSFLGKGLASGSQSQLKFIPASQTDFIYAVISEELGFIGAAVVVVLYVVLFYRLFRIAQRTDDEYALYLVAGILILFFSQFMINIGMNLGIMPVTGISLPFMSYGGSFLVISFLLLGAAQSIYIRTIKYRI